MRAFPQGVDIVKGVFDKEEMDMLRHEAYEVLNRLDDITAAGYRHRVVEWNNGHPGLVFYPALASPILNDFRTDERLINIVSEYLGPNIKQLNNQLYYREPGDTDEFAWHQDIIFRQPYDRHPNIEDAYIQTIIVVDDITEDNGAIEFIPGTHKMGDLELTKGRDLRKFERYHPKLEGLESKKYTAESGDVMLWCVLTVHGSERNVSTKPRMTYMNGFTSADTALDFPYILKDGEIVRHLDAHLIP